MKGDGKIIEALDTNVRQEFDWNGGEGIFLARCGSWSGRNIKLQQLIGGAYVDMDGATLTADGGFKFVTTAPKLGIVLSSATVNTVYVSVQGL